MTKIPLRLYIREIEEAIDEKQIEEAIAHCRHVLKSYPKHIDTYRLLGKAFLESQRYVNAADIFQRVLSSVPNDFVSHIGMSIIREDEGNMDASIWHMERAFESQPYNTAIQGELRRLYGLRDGMEPPKIRMTKGALAQMYAKSDLYDQAIAEIRSHLSTEPNRADLLILLAQMYAKNGQTTEAIDVCSSLLQRFPYSLDANRLLSELLPEDEREIETRTYRQRILDIDPYYAYVTSQSPTLESVPDQAVTINRLDWTGGIIGQESSERSEWVQPDIKDLGGKEIGDDDLSNWLSDPMEDSTEEQADSSPPDQSGDEIPDWIQEAGWEPSSGDFDESDSKIEYKEIPTDEEAIEGEIPSWLLSMAPDVLDEEGDEETAETHPMSKVEPALDLSGEELDFSSQDLPKEIELDSSTGDVPIMEIADESESVSSEDPDWLSQLGKDPEKGQLDAKDEEVPDWLSELEESDSQEEYQPEEDERTDAGELSVDSEWLKEIPTPSQEEVAMPNSILFDSPDEEEIPEWIQDIDAEKPEIEVEVESETSDISKWLENLEGEIPEPYPTVDTEQPPLQETPVEVTKTDDTSSVPAWLSNLEEEISEPEDIPVTAGEEVIGDALDELLEVQTKDQDTESIQEVVIDEEPTDLPDWLLKADDEVSEDHPSIETEETSISDKTEADIIEMPPDDISEMLQELRDLDPEIEGETISDVDTISHREAEPGEIPEWLEELRNEELPGEEEISEDIADLDEPIAEPAELPDWMLELRDQQPEISPEKELEISTSDELESTPGISEIPDWMVETEDKEIIDEAVEISDQILPTDSEEIMETSDLPDWMLEIGSKEPTASDESVSEIDDEQTDLPEWMLETLDADLESSESSLSDDQVAEELIVQDDSKDIPDWLEDLQDEKPIDLADEESDHPDITKLDDEALPADIPEWLTDLGEKDSSSSSELVDDVQIEEPSIPTQEEKSVDEDIDVPSWVHSVEGSKQETFPSGVTGWLEDFDEEEVSKVEIDYSTGELPTWLENLGEISGEGGTEKLVEGFDTEPVDAAIQLPESFGEEHEETELEGDAEFDDINEAMAWLENLAAKKGVPEDQLVTSPEDRTEEPPDWIQELSESPESADQIEEEVQPIPEGEEIPEWISETTRVETAQVEDAEALFGDIQTGEEISEEVNLDDPDTAISWLESLAEGKDVDDSREEIKGEEITGISDDALEEIEQPQPIGEIEDFIPSQPEAQDDRDGVDQISSDEVISTADEPDAIIEPEEIEITEPESDQQLPHEPEETPQPSDIPDWVLERITADSGDVKESIETEIEEEPTIDVDEQPEEELLQDLLSEEQPDETPSTEISPSMTPPPEDENEALRLEAQSEITRGVTPDAIKKYSTLVKKGVRVEDLISDLNQASLENINDEEYITILQLIGDAYMKIDKIQDALDAYTKAEKLIR